MAGFVNNDNNYSNTNTSPISSFLRKLANFGMDYSNEIVRNIRSIPVETLSNGINQESKDLGITDSTLQLAFSKLSSPTNGFNFGLQTEINDMESYKNNRVKYRQFALEDDIEDILDIICDESIVFDKSRKIATIELNDDIDEKLKDELNDIYNNIYSYFGFYDLNKIWHLYRKWLVDGLLAFEIVYDTHQKNIISFIEIDPTILTPQIDLNTGEKIWYVNIGDQQNKRILYDSQIIFIKYASSDSISKISYVARLIRAFNILRIMEATRIIFAVTNSSFKMQYIIPVGDVSNTLGEQRLSQIAANHRELVDFDWNNGEIKTNGQPMLQFYKQIFLASNGGETPQLQVLGGEGPQLNDTESLKYFRDKLRQASKIPYSRFEHEQMGGGNFTVNAEGQQRDEIRFGKFIKRLRNTFQELLVKPVYLQMCLNHKELATNSNFKVNLYLKYANDDVFAESKEVENLDKRISTISNMYSSLQTTDSDGNQIPLFSLEFLVKQYSGLSEELLKMNDEFKKRSKLLDKGYKPKDVEKIMDGADEKDFKPEKKDENEEGGGEEGGGESSSQQGFGESSSQPAGTQPGLGGL